MTIYLSLAIPIVSLGSQIYRQYNQRFTDVRNVSAEKRRFIEQTVEAIAQKAGITREIVVVENPFAFCGAHYNPRLQQGALVFGPILTDFPDAEQEVSLAHEIAHIKNKDPTPGTIHGLAWVITTLALTLLIPRLAFYNPLVDSHRSLACCAAITFGYLIAKAVALKINQIIEERADRMGFSFCTPAGKVATLSEFERFRDIALRWRNQEGLTLLERFWRRIKISNDGNNRFDFHHPDLTTRIAYFKELLAEADLPVFDQPPS